MPVPSQIKETGQVEKDFLSIVFQFGFEEARKRLDLSSDAARRILLQSGFSAPQIEAITSSRALGADLFNAAAAVGGVPEALTRNLQALNFLGDRTEEAFARGLGPSGGFVRDRLENLAGEGGEEPGLQRRRDLAEQLIGLGNARNAVTNAIQTPALDILSGGGFTPALLEAQEGALGIIAGGGRDADLTQVRDTALAMVSSGGFTPELQQMVDLAVDQIRRTGSMTPEMRRVFDNAQSIIASQGEGGGVLPTDQVVNAAVNAAQTAINREAAASIRRAQQRGASEAVTFAGTAGRPLAEFSVAAGQAAAEAGRQAEIAQQAARMQNFQAAQQVAATITGQQSQREIGGLSAADALLGDVARAATANVGEGIRGAVGTEQIAASRLASAFQAVPAITNAATNRFGTAGQVAIGGEQLVQGNAALANDILAGIADQRLQANQLLTQLTGIESGREVDLLGTAGNLALGRSELDFNQQMALQRTMLAINEFLAQTGQQGISNQLSAAEILSNQGANFLGFNSDTLRLMNAIALATMGANQPSFFNQFGSAFAGELPGIILGGGTGVATGGPIFRTPRIRIGSPSTPSTFPSDEDILATV